MTPSPHHLNITFAPRTEALVDALAEAVRTSPVGDPTVRECIVVQSLGMARWLELQLATRLGIWANPWFPFPEEFANRVWRYVARPAPTKGVGAFDREGLGWAVAAVLPGLLDSAAFGPLRTWVGPGRDAGRVLALSRRIGAVFYGYLLTRPDLLRSWEDEPESAWRPDELAAAADDIAWQAPLWQAVVTHHRTMAGAPGHPARQMQDAIDILESEPDVRERLGRLPRVSVFGLSALSPAYLRLLATLGRHIPVHVYSLVPSPEDARRVADAVRANGWTALGPVAPAEDEAARVRAGLPPAHPLIEDQASAVRAFQMLVALSGAQVTFTPDGDESAGTSLLARLQADVRAGRPPTACPEVVRAAQQGHDLSVGLHSCHGPLREVEVLRDQLLVAFTELPDLAPHDVIVMVPDVEQYAPYIEAVFGAGHADGTAIPYRIADRSARAARPGALAFDRALHVLRGRLAAPEVLDLLALAPVRAARGLDEDDLERLRAWVEAAGIRWGMDADHRASVGQPALTANTWRWGLERLALGWVAPGDGRARFREVLPFGPAGAEPALVGALADFASFLDRWRDKLVDAHLTMTKWADELAKLMGELVGDDPATEDDRQMVESVLGTLARRAHEAGFDGVVGLDVASGLVGDALAEDPPARGFLEGAVTVCALQPMRAIPFRVVALVGLNDGAFPRTDRPPGFDLAARHPRLGDTVRRDADRLLFLEAILCARDRLIITWTGQDARTDAALPPSVVVSELVDALRAMGDPAGRVGEDLVARHALHAFSSRYFAGSTDRRWLSYSSAYAGTAGRPTGERRLQPPFAPAPLPEPPADGERIVRLDALARFLERPAQHFVRDRLGIQLVERGEPLPDREPLTLDSLSRYHVGEAIVTALLDGASPDEAVAIAVANGRLPLGTPGWLDVAPVRADAERLAALAAPLHQGGPARVASVDLALPELEARVSGSLAGLWPAGRVEVGYGRLDGKRELRLWVRHLALNVAIAEGTVTDVDAVSWAVGRSDKKGERLVRLRPVPDAREQLVALVTLWQEAELGIVPFFPLAAQAYAHEVGPDGLSGATEPDNAEATLRKVATVFGAGRREANASAWQGQVDLDDPYLALALGDHLPWNEDGDVVDAVMIARFLNLTRAVYGPWYAAMEEWFDEDAVARLAGQVA